MVESGGNDIFWWNRLNSGIWWNLTEWWNLVEFLLKGGFWLTFSLDCSVPEINISIKKFIILYVSNSHSSWIRVGNSNAVLINRNLRISFRVIYFIKTTSNVYIINVRFDNFQI